MNKVCFYNTATVLIYKQALNIQIRDKPQALLVETACQEIPRCNTGSLKTKKCYMGRLH